MAGVAAGSAQVEAPSTSVGSRTRRRWCGVFGGGRLGGKEWNPYGLVYPSPQRHRPSAARWARHCACGRASESAMVPWCHGATVLQRLQRHGGMVLQRYGAMDGPIDPNAASARSRRDGLASRAWPGVLTLDPRLPRPHASAQAAPMRAPAQSCHYVCTVRPT